MTVRLELNPEAEANLAALARARGVALETYLKSLIEDLASTKSAPKASISDLRDTLERLAEMGKDLPHLPSSGFTRESIYRDHD